MMKGPTLPDGWEVEEAPSSRPAPRPASTSNLPAVVPPRAPMRLDPYNGGSNVRDLGSTYRATGEVVDGDTIRLNPKLSGRLFGIDAFETGQFGYRPGQGPLNLGEMAKRETQGYITPGMTVFGTGKQTFNRPVITLGNGPTDPARRSLLSGTALAAPSFMGADPDRRATYMEDERLARLNRQGAHGTQYMSPDVYRSAKRWGLKLRPDEELAFTSELPELRPEFQRLTDAEEQDYFAFLARNAGNANFGQGDLDAYWKSKGKVSQQADAKFLEGMRKGDRIGNIDYSSWDAATLADFKKQNAFAGMRPEVQDAYGSILADPNSSAATLAEFAKVNGMTFDPRDVSAYFAARAKGQSAPIPLPIINPGDGRSGAFGRGLADPFGFLDEMGGAVDAVAPAWLQEAVGGPTNRETVWNSDRDWSDVYENNTRQNRAIIDYDETHHPWWRLGGQATSGFALPYGGGVRSLSGLTKLGAAEGAVYGFGSGDGTLSQRLANVPMNAAIGAVLAPTVGTALNKGGEVLFPALQDTVQRFARLRSGQPDTSPIGRTRDTLDIAPGGGEGLPFPALPDSVPSAYPGPSVSGASPRERSWIDIGQQPPPSGGTLIDQVQALGQQLGAQRGSMAPRAAEGPELPPGWEIETPSGGVANMSADDALPSLSSPRLGETVGDAAVRPRPLLDPETEAMMRANAERVQPSDVLPRPSNEVQSLDEAMRINEGLYPEVRAPNERDMLTSRQFPSRANPDKMLNRRGPLDLVAYVREQGGLADFRGELKAAGLSNAARKGDDFTGGENRLGPLLNDESGSTLDDMALRAWEAGYFPDHAQRPTVDEFVTALGDTYRGINRTFRPDDFAEIDAHAAARDQRLAVERARQEGAPLSDDLGQPTTYDDMLANSPPREAYEDWRSAVAKRVGNINIERLNTPAEISQAMKVANDIGGGFDAARRGRMSFEETARLAEELGMTADDLLARRRGQAFNAEEAAAARALNLKASEELVKMATRFRRNGIEVSAEDMTRFREALLRSAAIQEQVSGMTAEAGRLLSQFRMAASSVDIPAHVLRELGNGPGGVKRLNEIAEGILEFQKDPRKLNQFVMRATKPRFSDMAIELMYNMRLSGPQTHAVNILSNTLTALAQIPEHMGAAAVGAIRRGIFRNKAERVAMSDIGQRAIGMMHGAWEGLEAAKQGWRTGEAADFVGKVETNMQKAIPNWAGGEYIRMPTRALTAEDEFFKAVSRRGQLYSMAAARARTEGLKGREYSDRIAELVDNPPDEMLEKALDFARYVTFQKQLGPIASRISAITNDYPLLKIIIPFIRTPSNLIKFGFERSPAAPLMKEWRDQVRRGGPDADLAISRMLMGTGVGMIVAQLAQEGKISGSMPKDETKANILLAQGWKPFSVKIGDQWVSYQRLDPFAMTIGGAADMATLGDNMSDEQLEDKAMIIGASIVNNLASKTWLSGVSDLLQAARDPERYGASFLRNQAAGLTVPAIVSQAARTMDPVRRETPTIGTAIQARIPGMSDNLFPKRDLWGKEITSEDAPGPDIVSPLWTSTERPDAIGEEILRVGANASEPSRIVGGEELSDQDYDDLQRLAGPTRRRYLEALMSSDMYRQANDETKQELIRKAMSAGRTAAKNQILSGVPIPQLQEGVRSGRAKKKAETLALPDGWVIEQ